MKIAASVPTEQVQEACNSSTDRANLFLLLSVNDSVRVKAQGPKRGRPGAAQLLEMELDNPDLRYEVREVIGKGAFGEVNLVVEKTTRQRCAKATDTEVRCRL